MTKGTGNQTLRKVKGHATDKDIAKGVSNAEDKERNNKSDELVDKCVEEIAGVGLVKLRKWCEERWKQYRKLMNRVHKIIIGVTLAEKTERAKQHTIFKATRGYDPGKWVKAKATIRDEEHLKLDYQDIDLIQPTKGKHKFTHCQALYEQVHAFLGKRKWAPVSNDNEVSGITWIELFALFDLQGKGPKGDNARRSRKPQKELRKGSSNRDVPVKRRATQTARWSSPSPPLMRR